MYHGKNMPGFPYHPHRGFETITINKEGVVDHSDSLEAAGRFMAGDVQWMTAGKGIQHSEMFPLVNEDKGNPLEIFQIWLNLPKVSKMVNPHFKMLWNEDIPVLNHKDESGKLTTVQVIAGKLNAIKALNPTPDSWAANPENAVGVYTAKMEAEASWTLPKTSSEANRTLFFYKGSSIEIEGKSIRSNTTIELLAEEDITIKNGNEEAYFLILEGKPIGEPVVQHGPICDEHATRNQRSYAGIWQNPVWWMALVESGNSAPERERKVCLAWKWSRRNQIKRITRMPDVS